MTDQTASVNKLDQPVPMWLMMLLPVYIIVLISLLVFPFAGDWRWLEGWVFVITLTLNLSISFFIINQKNPRVLRNRAKLKKEGLTNDTRQAASSDRFIYPLMLIGFFGAIIVPGLGHRFGWYSLSSAAAVGGVVIMNAGLIVVNIATLQNSFASKLLDIKQDQVLVDTGLYAHVRHPLYAGGIIVILFTPIALGSLWGLIPAFLGALTMNFRIQFEEEMLVVGMAGYEDYQSRVRYKLIPGVY